MKLMTRSTTADGRSGRTVEAPPPTADERLAAAQAALGRTRSHWWTRSEGVLLPTIGVLVVLVCWELYGRSGRIDPIQFSYPSEIWTAMRGLMSSGRLWTDLRVSSEEFALGFLVALVGVPLGLLFGVVRRLGLAVDPIVTALYSTPIVALTPLVVIWFGLGMSSKVAVIALIAVFPMMINTIEGVRTVDPDLVRAARSFGASPLQVVGTVVLPASLPFVIAGVRLAIGRAMIGLVVGEFLASTAGLGFSIRFYAENFRTAEYLGLTLLLMAVAVVLTSLLRFIERRIAPWLHTKRS